LVPRTAAEEEERQRDKVKEKGELTLQQKYKDVHARRVDFVVADIAKPGHEIRAYGERYVDTWETKLVADVKLQALDVLKQVLCRRTHVQVSQLIRVAISLEEKETYHHEVDLIGAGGLGHENGHSDEDVGTRPQEPLYGKDGRIMKVLDGTPVMLTIFIFIMFAVIIVLMVIIVFIIFLMVIIVLILVVIPVILQVLARLHAQSEQRSQIALRRG